LSPAPNATKIASGPFVVNPRAPKEINFIVEYSTKNFTPGPLVVVGDIKFE
jgi:hypothetical protein